MSVIGERAFRLVLLLYPAEFRHRYGDDMVQLMIDQQLHDRRRASSVLLHETFDAVRTAPRMRLESPMRIGFLAASRIQHLYAQGRLDHFEYTCGDPTAWWRITCTHCLTDFVTWDTGRRYCSEDCRTDAKRARKQARLEARAARTRAVHVEAPVEDPVLATPRATR